MRIDAIYSVGSALIVIAVGIDYGITDMLFTAGSLTLLYALGAAVVSI